MQGIRLSLAIAILVFPAAVSAQPGYRLENVQPGDVITNAAVLRMLEQRLPDEVIVARINRAAKVDLDARPDAVNRLREAGASNEVIQAVMQRATERIQAGARAGAAGTSAPDSSPMPHRFVLSAGAGLNAASRIARGVSWSAGAEGWGPVTPYLSLGGSYFYNRLGKASGLECRGTTCVALSARANVHDVLGGLKLSVPGRFSPYAVVSGGAAIVKTGGRVGLFRLSSPSETKAAIGIGGGVEAWLSARTGVFVDFRVIRPSGFLWYGRVSVGPTLRF